MALEDFAMTAAPAPDLVTAAAALLAAIASVGSAAAALIAALRSRPEPREPSRSNAKPRRRNKRLGAFHASR